MRAESPPPTISAAGANDWSCKPTAAHPSPVVIVHGTFGDSKSLLDRLSWSMHRAGYCVFAIDYGNRATGPIENSAQQLSDSCPGCSPRPAPPRSPWSGTRRAG